MKKDLKIGDRVKVNFKKATEDSTNEIYVSNLKRKIEATKKLGTGYFIIDQLTDELYWLIAEEANIGDISVKKEAVKRKRK